MIFVAIAELVLIGTLIYLLREQLVAAHRREAEMRTQLLSVLGKTETVSLTLQDQRPKQVVSYIDEELEAELARATEQT